VVTLRYLEAVASDPYPAIPNPPQTCFPPFGNGGKGGFAFAPALKAPAKNTTAKSDVSARAL
jgi:hypothetical protein